ncbi:unnamed protein product [Orchesella dallaii]|uniref:Uncharacterized protein n=1 Tax=Orchesella dallaii TaxID=48710 RepID=A0ABP1Q8Y3_9HEXA
MKANCTAPLLLVVVAVSVVLAYPSSEHGHHDQIAEENKVSIRTRRGSMDGIFDSIAQGVEDGLQGITTVTTSIKKAFESVFSDNNKNAVTDGFNKFTQGIKNAFNGFFGVGGEKVKKGFKKIEEAVKKGTSPSGEVPAGETT